MVHSLVGTSPAATVQNVWLNVPSQASYKPNGWNERQKTYFWWEIEIYNTIAHDSSTKQSYLETETTSVVAIQRLDKLSDDWEKFLPITSIF